MVGQTVTHYRVLRKIGAGGMAEVFEAEDARLGRHVALKFLPQSFSRDVLALERFQREARAVSALNHPSICTIFDIGDFEGTPFLALELLEGETLQSRIGRKPLPIDDLLDWAIQIAGGLAAAHAKGIVHRDIKPANIFVTRDGHAKILDFGLSKQVAPLAAAAADSSTLQMDPQLLTSPGSAVGTVVYMSPEQARGQEVDARTDLFSFGVVLYQMATAQLPFAGTSMATVFDAILNRDSVPPSRLNAALPAGFDATVMKALEKDRAVRYQSAADVLADLKRLRRDVAGSSAATPVPAARPPAGFRKWLRLGAVGLALAAAIGFVTLRQPKNAPAAKPEWKQITAFPDAATAPALSADGRMLAFTRGEFWFMGRNEVYVKMLPDGAPVQLTRDGKPKMYPVFSADGSNVAYTARGWETWLVPIFAGNAPRLLLPNAEGLNWIGAGQLMFSEMRKAPNMAVVTSSESRTEQRDVYVPPSDMGMAHFSSLSPDRKQVLVVEMLMPRGWIPCRLVPFDGSSSGRQVGPVPSMCTAAAWSPDGQWMYFTAETQHGSHIWRQAPGATKPEQLTFGPTQEYGVAVAPDGRSLYTSAGVFQAQLRIHTPAGDRQVSGEGSAEVPQLTADGTRLYYKATRELYGPGSLWVADSETGRAEPALPGVEIGPWFFSLNPAATQVAYVDPAGALWIANLDRRSPPRKLSAPQAVQVQLMASGSLYHWTLKDDGVWLYRIGTDGSSVKVLPVPVGRGAVSPDEKWVTSDITGANQTQAIPLNGGQPRPLCRDCTATWAADGRSMLFHYRSMDYEKSMTLQLPCKPGEFPSLPSAGLSGSPDAEAKVPGARLIQHSMPQPATAAGAVYAYGDLTGHTNIFRITLP